MDANKFADGKTIDPNKVHVPYVHQTYPKMMYHENGRVVTVASEKEERAATRKGFGEKPVAGRDYHLLRNGVAPLAKVAAEEAGDVDLEGDGTDDDDQSDADDSAGE